MPSPAGPNRLPALLIALTCALLAALPASAVAAGPVAHIAHDRSPAISGPTALIALMPVDVAKPPPGGQRPSVADLIDGHPELALGMLSATQSGYSPQQSLLDITSGTRTSRGTYHPQDPPEMSLLPIAGATPTGLGSGLIVNWLAAVARAESAPADVVPGLLASSIPGGAGHAGIHGQPNTEALVAATRAGVVDSVSLGRGDSVAARAGALLQRHRFVVALLPAGYAGDRQLDELIAARRPGELLVALEDPPPFNGPQLLWAGIAGLGPADAGFTSATTHVDGIAAAIDLLPTILGHLGERVPSSVRGQPIHVAGARDAAALQQLNDRLAVIGPRRIPALETFLFTWLGLVLLAGIVRDRAGVRFGMRIGGLALLWLPALLLLGAALSPSQQAELFLIAGGSFALALLTDLLLPWPRGPALPAILALVAYTLDLANHSHLIIRSLLGPSPRSGARFYGLGNELEIALTIVLLVALAGVVRSRARTRGNALAFALGGVALAAVVGSGRLGADVGGIFTIAGGTAVATLMLLPGGLTKRAIAIAIVAPLAGVAALAALELATGGDGHFTRTVLHGSVSDQLNTLQRRYELAWSIVSGGYAPLLTTICALAVAYAIVHRGRVYVTIRDDAVWRAALCGGLAASVSGSLFNDSGPILFFIGVVSLGFVTAYLRSPPGASASVSAGEGEAAATGLPAESASADRAAAPPAKPVVGEDARPAAEGAAGAPVGGSASTGPARSSVGALP
ncbi:MAG TPA: hypothetical protein VFF79_04680 [Conexibacter sp.]|jgi:hypothetical protein|nr:hypothetical protein [Conexibacter sp.]